MSDTRLQKWALAAEVFGAIAVVVTLGFLVFEMRDNTNALQAQTYQALMGELNDYREFIADPERLELGVKLRSDGWSGLSNVEQIKVRMAEVMRWGIYESAYYANERGILGEREWKRFDRAICRALETVGAEMWEPDGMTPMSELLTPDFVQYVNTSCR